MDQIVEAAGLTRITVHRRFGNRQALLEAPVAGRRSVGGSSGRVGVDSLAMPGLSRVKRLNRADARRRPGRTSSSAGRETGVPLAITRSRTPEAIAETPTCGERNAVVPGVFRICPVSTRSRGQAPPCPGWSTSPRDTGPVSQVAGSQGSSVRWR
ncbi:hypothetical protein [Streptomyces sp. NPDC003015]